MMKWFGQPWPSDSARAPVCADDADRVPVPVGEICVLCDNRLTSDDRGVVLGGGNPVHTKCLMDAVLGREAQP